MLLEDFRKGLMHGKAHLPSRATRVIELFSSKSRLCPSFYL